MLYVDVTETRKNGLNTGIQRVVKEICKELNLMETQCTFVFFDNLRFQKVSYGEFSGKLKNYSDISKVRIFLRNKFPFLKKIAKNCIKFLKILLTALKMVPDSIFSKNKIEFFDGDVLLLLDAAWSRNDKFQIEIKKILKKVRVVSVCYDMITISHPDFFEEEQVKNFRKFKLFAIKNIREFICISKFTAIELESFIAEQGFNPKNYKINWFHLGFSLKLNPYVEINKIVNDPYILSVSTLEPRKNYGFLIDAFNTANIPKEIKLVIVGRDGWKNSDVKEKIKKNERIIWLKKVDDVELVTLYKNCKFFVFPSVIEGYGLPVLEATSFGKLAISSNSGSLPEVVGDFAEYFSPHDQNALILQIERFCKFSELLLKKEKRIFEEFKPRTWRESTLDLLDKMEISKCAREIG